MGVPGTPHKIATVRAHWPWVSSSSSHVSSCLRQNNAAYLFTCKVVAILILVLIYIVVSAKAAAAAMTVVKAQSRPAVLVVHLQYTFDDRGAAQSVCAQAVKFCPVPVTSPQITPWECLGHIYLA